MIKGINHITFSVSNLNRSFDFYKNILDFSPLMKNKKSAYFLAGDTWFCIEEDPEVRSNSLPEYTHIAFTVNESDFESVSDKIKKSKAVIFKENKSEGNSLYFLDPDGHKLEIHVGDWQTRLQNYKKNNHEDYDFFD